MSVKKSKLDLLIRVRYQNPLPPPPCPPKLIAIPTDPMRYANISFTHDLANELPLPMVVDAEMGMPIDLMSYESLWMESNRDGVDDSLNPDSSNPPPLDPKDAWMASESLLHQATNGSFSSFSGTNTAHVPWLRKTEYISRESVRPAHSQEFKVQHDQPIDVSHQAQIDRIEASFASASTSTSDLSKLRYPTKPHLKAVESWDVLPDESIWPNAYDLFKFAERPGDRPVESEDPRLECSVLRPMESDGEHFLAYYILKDDESIAQLESQRNADPPDENSHTLFQFVRDYETVKIEQDISNEFLLVFQADSSSSSKAYYKNIERKINVKKKRINKQEEFLLSSEKWDVIQLCHTEFSKDEEEERQETMLEVTDPIFMLRDAQAEGEGDADAEGDAEGELIVDEVKEE